MIAAIQNMDAQAAEQAMRHRKLVDAAQQFEAMFLQQMMKSSGVDGESASDGSTGGEMYKSFGNEAVAKAVAAAGGLGIARQVVRQVEHGDHKLQDVQKKDETVLKLPETRPIELVRRPE